MTTKFVLLVVAVIGMALTLIVLAREVFA